jgi:hypothetical protein
MGFWILVSRAFLVLGSFLAVITIVFSFGLGALGPALFTGILATASFSVAFGTRRIHLIDKTSQSEIDPAEVVPDILYLRPFQMDKGLMGMIPGGPYESEMRSLQEYCLLPLRKQGVHIVSVHVPKGHAHSTESVRLSVDPQVWTTQVETLAEKTKMILLLSGSGTGISQELRILGREELLKKTMIIVPPSHRLARDGWKAVLEVLGDRALAVNYKSGFAKSLLGSGIDAPPTTQATNGLCESSPSLDEHYLTWLLENEVVALTFIDHCQAWRGKYSIGKVSHWKAQALAKLIRDCTSRYGIGEP